MTETNFKNVIGFVQMYIRAIAEEAPITREIIADSVTRVLALNPQWRQGIDAENLTRELEARFSVWIGRETSLIDEEDHISWLSANRGDISWRYSDRYRLFLGSKWPQRSIEVMDDITDRILGLLENPQRPGAWDRRGLVVGHVQSGKTANYISLICKAADAGYKLFVVLAGIHNNLRSQTQLRLDEGFLGYESRPHRETQRRALRLIGVGPLDPELRTDTITNRNERGDFSRAVARNFSINPGGRPLLFVVKKNARVLNNLLDWVEWAANSQDPATGSRIVTDVPLLVVDDEADHASVDTNEQPFDENGEPDPDHDPTAINKCIRRLLRYFEKSAYVGYTATPFANIFIHESARTAQEGEDIFPRSFIINLPVPSNYAGPVRIFGLNNIGDDPSNPIQPLPLIREIQDNTESAQPNERAGWMPPRHRNGHRPLYGGLSEVPPSLRNAIYSFILSCCVRQLRGQVRVHNSMLVHVTRFTSVQQAVFIQVREEIDSIRRRIRRGEGNASATIYSILRQLWESDFVPTTCSMNGSQFPIPQWSSIEPLLDQVVSSIEVRQINGSVRDVLDYESNMDTGLNVIAIGGDKLSRGLTLEGLVVSYFLRASRMYDTLMQMGRWFGYRPDYLDLCRLYTTPELIEWYEHITEANEELRQEFDHMAAVGGTPRDYGLKVRSHPALMITSRVKLRTGVELQLSFSGSVSETVVFHRDHQILEQNIRACERLIRTIGSPTEISPVRNRPEGRQHRWDAAYLWKDIPANEILSFLAQFSTHPANQRVDARLLSEYIEKQNRISELQNWTVAVIAGESENYSICGLDVPMTIRSPNTRSVSIEQQHSEGRHIIGRLLSPRDEAIDLDLEAYQAALAQTRQDSLTIKRTEVPNTPSGPRIREHRHPNQGLLLLYALSPRPAEINSPFPIIGVGISFPFSERANHITYRVNNIYWSQEYGGDL